MPVEASIHGLIVLGKLNRLCSYHASDYHVRIVLYLYGTALLFTVNKMHKKSASLVKAETQANIIKAIQDDLTEEELAVYKRGRNAKSATTAKHATMIDYRMATGFEALIGYLYLQAQHNRLLELIRDGLEKIGELS